MLQVNDALETAGPGLDLDATDAVADRFDGAVVLYVVSTVLVFVSLAVFLRQAYVAAQRLGVRELRYSPTWALLGWLVPVMALWVPKRIVDDVWRSANARDSSWTVKDTPGLVTVWWTGVIVTLFASRVAFSNPLLLRLFTILDVLVALLGIAVVLGITRRLASRAAALGSPMKDGDLMAARAPAGAPSWTVPVLAVAASVLLLSGTAAATIQGAELPAGAEGSPAAVADPAPTSPPPLLAAPSPLPLPAAGTALPASDLEGRLRDPGPDYTQASDATSELGDLDADALAEREGLTGQEATDSAAGLRLLGFQTARGHVWAGDDLAIFVVYRFEEPKGAQRLLAGIAEDSEGAFTSATVPGAPSFQATVENDVVSSGYLARGRFVYEVTTVTLGSDEPDRAEFDRLLKAQRDLAERSDP